MSSIDAVVLHARLDHLEASNAVLKALINYEKFNERVVQRMDRHIASLRSRIKEFQDYLYDYGGPSEYYEDLEDLKEELYECRIQQRENNSHAQILKQRVQEKELYLEGLEIRHLQQKSDCVKHEVDDEQPKVCVNSNLEIALDLDSTNAQHVENENVSQDIVCSEDVLEHTQISDCSSLQLLDNVIKEDTHVEADDHVVEVLPLVPSTLHVNDKEMIGDAFVEIEQEQPPTIVFKLLDYDDPMLRVSCHIIKQDLRTNLLKGEGNDTPIMCTLGAVCEYDDHHESSKGIFDSYGVFGLHGVAWKLIHAYGSPWRLSG